MARKSPLYDLIHSLTQAEKRYFRVFAAAGGKEKDYLKVFDAMMEMDADVDAELRARLKGEKFLKRLPAVRNYLYKQILLALKSFHRGKDPENRMREYLDVIQVLGERGLYEQCQQWIDKGKKLALKHGLFQYLGEIIAREMWLIDAMGYPGHPEARMRSLIEADLEAAELVRNLRKYKAVSYKLTIVARKEGLLVDDRLKLEEFRQIFEEDAEKWLADAKSAEAKGYWLHSGYNYYLMKGDNANAMKYAGDLVRMMEEDEEMIFMIPQRYIAAINNLILTQVRIKDWQGAEGALVKLRDLHQIPGVRLSENIRIRQMTRYFNLRLSVYMNSGRYAAALGLVPEIEANWSIFDREFTLLFSSQLYKLHFITGQHAAALDWLNKIFSREDISLRHDLHCTARIIYLIIQYEIGNEDILDHILRSTYRFFYKMERIGAFEKVIMKFLKDLLRLYRREDLLKAFQELRMKLQELKDGGKANSAFYGFDYISWLDSKIEGRPLAAVMGADIHHKERED